MMRSLGAGGGFPKQSALNFSQLTYGLPSVGQLGWARQTGVGPLPKIQQQLPLFEIHGDVPSAVCVLQPPKVRSSSPFPK